MPIKPVSRVSLSDAVFTSLRDQILSGELAPEATLPGERELCAAFHVNRGALREALKRLEQLGLVQVRQGGATRVRDFQAEGGLELLPSVLVGPDAALRRAAVRSVFELRSAIGPDLVGLAAQRRTEKDLRLIEATIESMAKVSAPIELQRLSMLLWEQLAKASGNVAYRFTYNSMKRAWAPVQDVIAQSMLDEIGDITRYRKLARALRDKDAAKASKVARELLDHGFRGVLEYLGLS